MCQIGMVERRAVGSPRRWGDSRQNSRMTPNINIRHPDNGLSFACVFGCAGAPHPDLARLTASNLRAAWGKAVSMGPGLAIGPRGPSEGLDHDEGDVVPRRHHVLEEVLPQGRRRRRGLS